MRPKADTLLTRFLRRFGVSARGGVAIWFGVMAPFVAVGTLGVVDYGAASMYKQTMQDALDDAAIVAAKSTGTTNAAIDTTGDAAFAAIMPSNTNLTGLSADSSGRIANATFSLSGSTVVASASATYTPLVSHLLLGGPITVHANSQVVRGLGKLEIAMVLDTTGSMQGTKLSNLISSAKTFVTDMETAASQNTVDTNPIKISIVPFSTTVKVAAPLSMSSYNTTTFAMSGLPTWLDGRGRSWACNNDIFTNASCSARTDRFAILKAIGRSWGGCVEARVPPYDIREDAPNTADPNTLFTPFFWPDEPDTNSDYLNDYLNDVTSSSTWTIRQGYVAKYNTSTFKASGTFIPSSAYGAGWVYGPNAACDMQQLMRLSTNFTALRSQIDGLVASGETNIPLGLMWGWHTLSPNLPFGDGVAYGTPNVTKIIVLMTDGDNTMNDVGSNNMNNSLYHGYGYIWQNRLGTTSNSAVTGKMNDRMVPPTGTTNEALCTNIKAKSIYIYTVGVGVSSQAKTLLQNCATTTNDYYDVNSTASNLNTAFTAIAGSITRMRISQ